MRQETNRARWALLFAAAMITVSGCNVKNELLQPQNPGIVDQGAVGSPAAAAALKVGALGRLKQLVNGGNGETLWAEGGHLADEFMNSDFQNSRNDIDQRTISPDNTLSNYNAITTSRGYIRDAIVAEQTFEPQKTADIGELYLALAFIEMQMGEDFCNGIPLGSNDAGVVDYSSPDFQSHTTAEVFTIAQSHIDSGLTIIGSASDVNSVAVRNAALITKARILVDKGQFAAAAALVPSSAVPSTYQYLWITQAGSNGDDLGIWSLNNSVARITVGDSAVEYQGKSYTIANAIPFASLNDPRVPVVSGLSLKLAPEDGLTPLFIQQIWTGRDDPIPMVSGIDARLIEAEGKLQTGDYAGMMTILNALRAAPPKIANFQPGSMSALATTPATKDDATSLFFREKALWTFGRGQRLGDLRRLIRQYGRTQDKVFPSGEHYKGGNYGTDVNLPVPDGERVNPNFTGCLDRSA
jgi:hypothetical protein